MPKNITKRWTLVGGEFRGWGYCGYCGEVAEGGGDFCSLGCAENYYEVIPPLSSRLPPLQFSPHNCKHCEPLGSYHEWDLYLCVRPGAKRSNVSLIGRYGNEPHEYASMPVPEAFDGDPETFYRQADEWYRVLICRAQGYRLL
jgi:hypothetical protein